MARLSKEQILERDMRNRKFRFLEKILLARPQIEDAMISTALGQNKEANESKRLEMCRLLCDISDKYLQEIDADKTAEEKQKTNELAADNKSDEEDTTVVNFG